VCRAWAAAAVAAPAAVNWKPTFSKPQQFKQLRDWLRKHGGAVVAFTAKRADNSWSLSRPLQLPIAKLKQLRILDLENLKVQLIGIAKKRRGASLTGTSPVLPQLQELRLSTCQVSVQLSAHLLSASALTKLHWEHVTPYNDNTDPVIAHPGWDTERTRQGLPLLLHQLQLLQQQPKLSELKLAGYLPTAAGIAVLGKLQHLQHFSLRLQDYSEDHEPCARALLAALQHLTQLQHLELHVCGLCAGQPHASSFSALTASTQLTTLSVTDGVLASVPQAAFGHMFPSGHVLPSLKVLRIGSRFIAGYRPHCVDSTTFGSAAC
jgi:hypothetical protein